MRKLVRRVAERAARKAAWESFKIALKRLGLPFWFWPALWAGKKFARLTLWMGRKIARHRRKHKGGPHP